MAIDKKGNSTRIWFVTLFKEIKTTWNGLITIKVRGFRFWNNEGSTGRSNMQLKCAVKECCDRLQILICMSLKVGGVFSHLDRLLKGIWPWGIWHTVCHLWGMLQLLHWVLRVQFIISWGLFCLFHCDNIFLYWHRSCCNDRISSNFLTKGKFQFFSGRENDFHKIHRTLFKH